MIEHFRICHTLQLQQIHDILYRTLGWTRLHGEWHILPCRIVVPVDAWIKPHNVLGQNQTDEGGYSLSTQLSQLEVHVKVEYCSQIPIKSP